MLERSNYVIITTTIIINIASIIIIAMGANQRNELIEEDQRA